MKIALITDTHFGARSDSQVFDKHFEEFFTQQFFPYLKNKGIDTVIHLGDIFDRRKQINFNTLQSCRKYFFDVMYKRKIQFTSLVGNHDTFFKNTNVVNSPALLLGDYTNVRLVTHPEVLTWDKLSILMVPWICDDNEEDVVDQLQNAEADVCFGHFEIAGFAMYRGMTNVDGIDPSIFDRFKLTCSGHYHHRNSSDKIFYLGSPYQMTWSDADDARGFHVFDTDTLLMEFVENTRRMFHKIQYDDTKTLVLDGTLAGCAVKLIVVNKTDFARFDSYVEALQTQIGVADLKIVEDFSEFESDALDDDEVVVEDTMGMLSGYVDSIETDANKTRIKTMLHTLYVEAQHLE